MSNKVRVIKLRDHDGNMVDFYTIRGWYAKVNSKALSHARNRMRFGMYISSMKEDDEVRLDNGCFSSPEEFLKIINEHEEYLKRNWGTLQDYFSMN